MEPLFPDTVPVPRGLVTDRMILGVPPWVFVLLLMLAAGPAVSLGPQQVVGRPPRPGLWLARGPGGAGRSQRALGVDE